MTNRMSKGWLAFHIIATIIIVGVIATLGTFLGISLKEKNQLSIDLENRYKAAYYGLLTNMVDIENYLAKTRVMTGGTLMEETLNDIDSSCQLANVYLSVLTTKTNNMANLNRYLNQLGGYSHYVAKNIMRGEEVSEKDRENFSRMWEISREYGKALSSLQNELSNGYSFIDSLGRADDKFEGLFKNLDSSAVEYPSLIYDGPFSDGVTDREAKGTVGEELSESEARELLKKYLVGYDIVSVDSVTENNNRIPSYIYSVTLKGERDCTVQIAKKGGLLLMLDLYHEVVEPKLTMEQCKVVAEQYCESIGLENMKAVWINNNNSNVYINMCYEQDGVIMYPDMIKLKISLDTGEVIGYEGLNYAFNHIEREKEDITAEKDMEDIVLSVSSVLEDVEARLVMIPINVTSEELCYEVVGKYKGEEYFIYLDARTGEEVKVLRMIDSNQGDLLM